MCESVEDNDELNWMILDLHFSKISVACYIGT